MRMIILIVTVALLSTTSCYAFLSLGPSEAVQPAIEQPNKDAAPPDAPKAATEPPGTGLPLEGQKPAVALPNSRPAARPHQDYTKRRSPPTSPRNSASGTGGRARIQGLID